MGYDGKVWVSSNKVSDNKEIQSWKRKEEGYTFETILSKIGEKRHGENYLVSRVPNFDIVVLVPD